MKCKNIRFFFNIWIMISIGILCINHFPPQRLISKKSCNYHSNNERILKLILVIIPSSRLIQHFLVSSLKWSTLCIRVVFAQQIIDRPRKIKNPRHSEINVIQITNSTNVVELNGSESCLQGPGLERQSGWIAAEDYANNQSAYVAV